MQPPSPERVRQALIEKQRLDLAAQHPEFFEGWTYWDEFEGRRMPVDPTFVRNCYVAGMVYREGGVVGVRRRD